MQGTRPGMKQGAFQCSGYDRDGPVLHWKQRLCAGPVDWLVM